MGTELDDSDSIRLEHESHEHDLELQLTRMRAWNHLFAQKLNPVRRGRFEVVQRLGSGGSGSVYEAYDPDRQCKVALKILTRFDATAVYRLKREFRSLSDVVHPNLVVLHELFVEEPQLYFTMELLDGVSFSSWVRTADGTLDEARLRAALPQLACGVSAIHAAGKLHCDVKPSNVMVTPAGRIVLLDFGLVREAAAGEGQAAAERLGDLEVAPSERRSAIGVPLSAPSGLCGTPAYIAPERTAGLPAGPPSDWYSVGVVLFEALTGRLPFEGNPSCVLSDKRARDAPDPRSMCGVALPLDLCRLCNDLLQRDPVRRAGADRLLPGANAPTVSSTPLDSMPSAAPMFVGRKHELAWFERGLECCTAGSLSTLWVSGPSGIGKSALLDDFADIAGQRALVLRGRCHERESVPYKAVDGVVDALARHLRTLPHDEVRCLLPQRAEPLLRQFPVLGRVQAFAQPLDSRTESGDMREQRSLAFAALRQLLRALSERTPVVMIVDDLQWGDLDSERLLRYLLEAPDPPALLFVGAYRSDEVESSEFLRAVFQRREPNAQWLPERKELGPLDNCEALEMVRRLIGGGGTELEGLAHAIASEAEGLPFLISELAQHAHASGSSGQRLERNRPCSLEQAISRRVTALSSEQRRLLHVLSVAAAPIEHAIAVDAAGRPDGSGEALASLRASRLIRFRRESGQDCAETYHDRVRGTVVSGLAPDAVSAIHAEIARAMERRGVHDAERLIAHYLGARDHTRAGRAAVQAAHAASEKMAFNRAAELFAKALELLSEHGQREHSLHRHLGDALANAGRGVQAAGAYLKAAEYEAPEAAISLRQLAAQQYLRSGRFAEGTQLARQLLAEVGIEFPDGSAARLIAHALWQRARVRLCARGVNRPRGTGSPQGDQRIATLAAMHQEIMVDDGLRGAVLHAQFLRLALASGDRLRTLQALAWEVIYLSLVGTRRTQGRISRELAEVCRLRDEVGTPHAVGLYDMAYAVSGLMSGRYATVLEPARRAERIFQTQCTGTSFERDFVGLVRYGALEFVGDLREMTSEVPARIRDASDRDDHLSSRLLFHAMANSYLAAGDADAALSFLERQRTNAREPSTLTALLLTHRIAEALLYRSEDRQAIDYMMSHWPDVRRSVSYRGAFHRSSLHCLRARCAFAAFRATGDSELRAMVQSDIELLKRLHCFSGFATALHGALRLHLGDVSGARRLTREALHEFESQQVDRCATYARWRLGELTGGEEGDRLLNEAGAQLAGQVRDPARWVALMFGSISR